MKRDLKLTLRTVPAGFTDSVLALTMATAERHKMVILQCLTHLPQDWPFKDRVLAWLVPSMEREINHFHANNGPSMAKMFQPHQIAHLDKDFNKQLYARVRTLRDITTSQLLDLD